MAIGEQTFGFFIPTVTLMGVGCHKELADKVKQLGGKRLLIVTDKGITSAGLTDKIVKLIREGAGVDTFVFDETIPNPTDTNVDDGVKVYQDNQCDMLISLGGGSAHDCGKGIGLVVSNGGKIHDYEGLDPSLGHTWWTHATPAGFGRGGHERT